MVGWSLHREFKSRQHVKFVNSSISFSKRNAQPSHTAHSGLLHELTSPVLLKLLPAFDKPPRFVPICTTAHYWTLFWAKQIKFTFAYSILIHFWYDSTKPWSSVAPDVLGKCLYQISVRCRQPVSEQEKANGLKTTCVLILLLKQSIEFLNSVTFLHLTTNNINYRA